VTAPCTEQTTSVFAARVLGVATEDESKSLDAHVAGCAACREAIAAIGTALAELAPSGETPPDVWSGVAASVDRLEGRGPVVSLTCTYCKDRLERPTAVFCAGCLAPHHADCFEEHGRCAACREKRFVHPSAPARPGRGRGLATVLAVALSGAVAAAALVEWRGSSPAVAAAGAGAASATPAPVPVPAETGEHAVALDVEDQPLQVAIAELNRQGGRKRLFTNAPGARVSFHSSGAKWGDCVGALAQAAHGTLVEKDSETWFVDVEPRVQLEAKGELVSSILAKLCSDRGKQLVFDGINGADSARLTLDVADASWEYAVRLVAESAKLGVHWKGDLVVVSPRELGWGEDDPNLAEARSWSADFRGGALAPVATRTVPSRRNRIVAQNTSVGTLARLLTTMEGRSVVVPQGYADFQVPRLDLHDVEWVDALAVGLGVSGFGVVEASGPDTCIQITNDPQATKSIEPHEISRLEPAVVHEVSGEAVPASLFFHALAIDGEGRAPSRAVLGTFLVKEGDVLQGTEAALEVVKIGPGRVDLVRTDTGSRFSVAFLAETPVRDPIPALELAADEKKAYTGGFKAALAAFGKNASDYISIAEARRLHDRLERAGLLEAAVSRADLDAYARLLGTPLGQYELNVSIERFQADLKEAESARDPVARDAIEDARRCLDDFCQPGWRTYLEAFLARLKKLEGEIGHHARAAIVAPAAVGRTVTVDLDDQPLQVAIDALDRQEPLRHVFTNAPDVRVSFHSTGKPWQETLDALDEAVRGERLVSTNASVFLDVEPRVSLDVNNDLLRDVLAKLCRDHGKQLVVDSEVDAGDARVSLRLRGETWSRALEIAAGTANLNLRRRGDLILATAARPDWGKRSFAAAERACWSATFGEDGVAAVVTRTASRHTNRIVAARGHVSVDALARLLTTMDGRGVVVPPIDGKLHVVPAIDLRDVEWIDALVAALAASGCGLRAGGETDSCPSVTAAANDSLVELAPLDGYKPEEPVRHSNDDDRFSFVAVAIDGDGKIPAHAVVIGEDGEQWIVKAGDRISAVLEVVAISAERIDLVRADTGSRYFLLFDTSGRSSLVREPIPALELSDTAKKVLTARCREAIAEVASSGDVGLPVTQIAEVLRLRARLLRAHAPDPGDTPQRSSKVEEVHTVVRLERVEQDLAEAERAGDSAVGRDALEDARATLDQLLGPGGNRGGADAKALLERFRAVAARLAGPAKK
jgi:hypothetical protein